MAILDDKYEIYQFLRENTTDDSIRSDIMNEAVQEEAAAKVIDKMLELTIGRYNKLDFKEIERSRGDVTECKFYRTLRDSIDTLCDIDAKTHNIPGATIVSTALNNLYVYKSEFTNAYRVKNTLAILLYNTMYYTVIEATSYLIATSVDFATDGKHIELDAMDTTGRNYMLITNLEKFNKEVASGRISKFITAGKQAEDFNNETKKTEMNESIIDNVIPAVKFALNIPSVKWITIVGVSIIALFAIIIPMIKLSIYLIFKLRHSISEACKLQAEIIDLNVNELEAKNADEKIIAKQMKSVENFRRIARKFALDCDNAESDAKRDERADNLNVNELVI